MVHGIYIYTWFKDRVQSTIREMHGECTRLSTS